jgi:hypothetical protein
MSVMDKPERCSQSSVMAPKTPDLTTSLLHLGVFWVALLMLQRVATLLDPQKIISSPWGQGAAVLAAALLGFIAWSFRRPLYKTLTSLPFAVALLLAIVVATGLGTLLIQSLSLDELRGAYGQTFARVLIALSLNDIFHSLWFGGFLVLLGLALVLVALKKRMWRPARWGQLVAHLGVVVIIIGGLIGFFIGQKGMLDLHQGQTSDQVKSMRPGGEIFSLPGFAVNLDKFEVERYNSEYRVFLYARSGDSYEIVRSYGVDELKDWTKSGDGSFELRVAKTYPDFQLRTELKADDTGGAKPAIELSMKSSDTLAALHLFAGSTGRDRLDMGPNGAAIRFQWNAPTDDELAAGTKASTDRHVVSVQEDPSAPPVELSVETGGSYDVAGKYHLRVLDYVPDFVYDTDQHKAVSRSSNPNNPALQVALDGPADQKGETRWLFANMPDFDMRHGSAANAGPRLVYSLQTGKKPAAREFLIIGATREWWELKDGQPVKRTPLGPPESGIPELGVSRYTLLASAIEVNFRETKSQEWNNPVIELEIRSNGKVRSVLVPSRHSEPVALPDHRTWLALQPKSDEVKAYRSTVTVLDHGVAAVTKTLAVNDPLHYKGYAFYQSNFRKEDPTYSGLQVVHDPGLPLVWTGFIMICAGVVYSFYVRPRLSRAGRDRHVEC